MIGNTPYCESEQFIRNAFPALFRDGPEELKRRGIDLLAKLDVEAHNTISALQDFIASDFFRTEVQLERTTKFKLLHVLSDQQRIDALGIAEPRFSAVNVVATDQDKDGPEEMRDDPEAKDPRKTDQTTSSQPEIHAEKQARAPRRRSQRSSEQVLPPVQVEEAPAIEPTTRTTKRKRGTTETSTIPVSKAAPMFVKAPIAISPTATHPVRETPDAIRKSKESSARIVTIESNIEHNRVTNTYRFRAKKRGTPHCGKWRATIEEARTDLYAVREDLMPPTLAVSSNSALSATETLAPHQPEVQPVPQPEPEPQPEAHEKSLRPSFCVCKVAHEDNETYIACDVCNDWFHLRCAGFISLEDVSTLPRFICLSCSPYVANDPRLLPPPGPRLDTSSDSSILSGPQLSKPLLKSDGMVVQAEAEQSLPCPSCYCAPGVNSHGVGITFGTKPNGERNAKCERCLSAIRNYIAKKKKQKPKTNSTRISTNTPTIRIRLNAKNPQCVPESLPCTSSESTNASQVLLRTEPPCDPAPTSNGNDRLAGSHDVQVSADMTKVTIKSVNVPSVPEDALATLAQLAVERQAISGLQELNNKTRMTANLPADTNSQRDLLPASSNTTTRPSEPTTCPTTVIDTARDIQKQSVANGPSEQFNSSVSNDMFDTVSIITPSLLGKRRRNEVEAMADLDVAPQNSDFGTPPAIRNSHGQV